MKFASKVVCTLTLAVAALMPNLAMAATKFIYLTRHAEKAATGTDPALTADGKIRAQNIAATLKKANIANIFSTAFVRTQQTAQPLSAILALPVQTYDPAQLTAFARQLLALPGNTLVVGHSDTTPELIHQLGGDVVPVIDETEFDRLYQVAIASNGEVTTTLLNSLPSASVTPCAPVTVKQTGLAATANNWTYVQINVPECANKLTVNMSGGTGDGDMHLRFGAQPTATEYSCRPYNTGNVESCVVNDPQAGVWYIGIKAYKSFTGVTIDASAVQ